MAAGRPFFKPLLSTRLLMQTNQIMDLGRFYGPMPYDAHWTDGRCARFFSLVILFSHEV